MSAPRTGQRSGSTPGQAGRAGAGRQAPERHCSRTACGGPAVATLTYVYSDSTAVLGPLATFAEPHCYDLCAIHAQRLTAPRGWEVLRLNPELIEAASAADDILAVADAVRDRPAVPGVGPGRPYEARPAAPRAESARRSHLRVLPQQ